MKCRLNPYAEFAYDGIVLNPMEVVFVKVKNFAVDARWTTPHTAVTYDHWMSVKVYMLATCLIHHLLIADVGLAHRNWGCLRVTEINTILTA